VKWLRRIYMGLVLTFLYAPIVMIIVFSFNANKSRASWGGFTLHWYAELFQNPDIMQALYYTLLIAVLSAAIATVAGTLAAIGLYASHPRTRGIMLSITNIPVVNPDIVTGISLMLLFAMLRMELGFVTMLISHIVFNIPYVVFSVLPKLRQMDMSTFEAAQDLGATPLYALLRVVIPQILPGMVTGAILAFTLSIDDFVISFFTTRSVQNLSIYIYSAARKGIDPTLYALMSLMFIAILLPMVLANLRTLRSHDKSRQVAEKNTHR